MNLQGSFFGSIESYINKAKALLPGVDTIYVSTDDPSVVSALPQVAFRSALPRPLNRERNASPRGSGAQEG